MLTQRTPEGRRLSDPLAWLLCGVLGVGSGLLGVLPVMYVVLAADAVAAQVGWGTVEPSLVDDGLGSLVTFAVGLVVLGCIVAATLGAVSWCWSALPAGRWWEVLGMLSLRIAALGAFAVLGGIPLPWPR